LFLSACAKPHGQTDTIQSNPTLSQQKTCSDQAEKSFKDSSFSDDKSSLGNTFTDHYDPGVSVCYVEVTTRHMLPGNKFQYTHLIYDAFEGRVYGDFDSFSEDIFSKDAKPDSCKIKPRDHDEILCKSSEEFDKLALQYFGTTPD
jgi:hypothetical protein